ncbi:hypothetical protein AVEN_76774-1 [Araneus ventricosus]|uniref:Uncharacterized protein n=1 Tax=Araneus ventricosus TaxID=182803 RepID=A0A4Y2B2Z3_ARAVE|nr:hypothetical protein AVEN_76774-1 [Araneus ventricosus]
MVKGHVIKYHKKTSPRPDLAPGSTLNDRPPMWSPHNSPHYERLVRRPPILLGTTSDVSFTPKRILGSGSAIGTTGSDSDQKERIR